MAAGRSRAKGTPFLVAVTTMCYRQVKCFLRMRSRVIMSVARPFMWLLFFGVGWSMTLRGQVAREVLGASFLEFVAPGVVMMSVFFTSFFAGTSVIWDREFGFLKETLVAPASRSAIILGRVLGDSLVALLQGCLTLAAACLLLGYVNPLGLPVVFAAMLLTSLVYAGLGTAIGSSVSSVESFQLVHITVAMPMMFLSGAVVPIHAGPAWLKMAALAVPLTYGVDAARSAVCGISMLPAWLDLAVLACLSLAMLVLAAKAFERSTIA